VLLRRFCSPDGSEPKRDDVKEVATEHTRDSFKPFQRATALSGSPCPIEVVPPGSIWLPPHSNSRSTQASLRPERISDETGIGSWRKTQYGHGFRNVAVVRYVLVPFFNILVGTKTRDVGGTLRRYNANRHSDSRLIDRLPGVLGT